MHIQDRNACIHHIHTVRGGNISDRSTSAHVDSAQFRCLEGNLSVIHRPADPADIFRVRVIAPGLAAGARIFVEHNSSSEISGIALLISLRIERVISGRYIRGEHAGSRKASSQLQFGKISAAVQKLRRRIFKEMGARAGRPDRADLLLIRQQAAAGILRISHLQKGVQGSIGADAVILPVSGDHAPVKAQIPRRSCRNHFKLGGKKIFLLHAIALFQNLKNHLLHQICGRSRCFFFSRICRIRSILFSCAIRFRRIPDHKRPGADQQVQIFTLNSLCERFLHLLRSQMNQQIRDTENRIFFLLADHDFGQAAVLLRDNAVDRKRNRRPLVFLNSTVVMQVQIRHLRIFIERILLQVQPGGIDMRSQDPHALLQRLSADREQSHRLLHPDRVHTVAGLQALPLRDNVLKVSAAGLFRQSYSFLHTLPLGLGGGHKLFVVFRQSHQLFQLAVRIAFPLIFPVHIIILLFLLLYADAAS